MKKVLVTGAKGQLGKSLQRISGAYEDLEFHWTDVDHMDITNRQEVLSVFRDFDPDFCINCAAYTQVDLAEQEPEKARLINVDAVGNLIEACNENHCTLFHISTDFVFDGKSDTPYTESSKPNPLSVYGRTKLEGEEMVFNQANQYSIFRTSWVFSEFGKNFVKTMLQLSEAHSELQVVDDQTGCPTYAGDLAGHMLEMILTGKGGNETYHFCNQGATTWYDFAKAIFTLTGKKLEVIPIGSKDFGSAAERPAYSVLDCSKIQKALGSQIRPWLQGLQDCLQRLQGTY
jgi:dTDP-4-dehydrorhamnose reductase